jgi:hypothetical protein
LIPEMSARPYLSDGGDICPLHRSAERIGQAGLRALKMKLDELLKRPEWAR